MPLRCYPELNLCCQTQLAAEERVQITYVNVYLAEKPVNRVGLGQVQSYFVGPLAAEVERSKAMISILLDLVLAAVISDCCLNVQQTILICVYACQELSRGSQSDCCRCEAQAACLDFD